VNVTPIRPLLVHYPACEAQAIGAVVQQLLADYGSFEISRGSVDQMVALCRESGLPCGCGAARLAAAENSLRLARKAWRAHLSDEHADRVARLEAERDALKAECPR
jgi:hypothetical protein